MQPFKKSLTIYTDAAAHLNLFLAKEYSNVPKMAMLLPATPSGVTAVWKTNTDVMMITTRFIVFDTACDTGSNLLSAKNATSLYM
mmetsp:Transcript_63765/g.179960  ORF Transcript_63765/g.179960 Transcript_63765/m.179960 type:complete len:85 (+) Transcript_63765:273-527(+)